MNLRFVRCNNVLCMQGLLWVLQLKRRFLQHTHMATVHVNTKEVKKGFLEGPVQLEDLPRGPLLTKRFPVRQKNKVRPIDDYKANMVNHSVTESEGVTVHTIDHVASMVSYWLRIRESHPTRTDLCAKCWDLSDAYKQIPLSDEAYEQDVFLAVYNPESGKASVFGSECCRSGSSPR